MRHLLALPLVLATAPGAGAEAIPGATKTFQGWTGTCNNLGACVALGTIADAETPFYIRIARDAGAAAAPTAKLVLAGSEAPKGGGTPSFALTAKTKGAAAMLGPFPAKAGPDNPGVFTTELAAGAAPPFIDAIRNADTLDYVVAGVKGTFDLKGLSATLRWIDAQQGRAGTPTALVAKGMTPIGQVPAPRPTPVISPAPTGSAQEIKDPVAPKAVLAKAIALKDCEREVVQGKEGVSAWKLAPDTLLFAVPCVNGAYNFAAALYLTDAKGGSPRPLVLPQAPGSGDDGAAPNILTNAGFDPATMTLSEFNKGRGIGDCGTEQQWLWTGKGFALFEASSLGTCAGVLPDDWPNTYQANRG